MKFGHLVLPALLVSLSSSAGAISLLDFGVGPAGYGTQFLEANDDSSTNAMPLLFSINFFGQNFNQFFVINNGNITFAAPLGS